MDTSETGSAVTWKYPSCILKGDNSIGEFYSIALTNNFQQADTGTKMIHLGKTPKAPSFQKEYLLENLKTAIVALSRCTLGQPMPETFHNVILF